MKLKFSTGSPTVIEASVQMRALARSILIAVSILTGHDTLHGQTDTSREERIAIVARSSENSVTLRWAPLTYATWREANENGYRIERYTITRETELVDALEHTIVAGAINPWPESRWEDLVTENEYAAVAAQALFGERFEVDIDEGNLFTVINKAKENEQRFAFALFSADMSPEVAKASGLWYSDTTVRQGEKYLYRVYVNDTPHYGSIFTGPGDITDLPVPLNLQGEFSETRVVLKWERPVAACYTAYVVERGQQGAGFRKISNVPVATLSRDDRNDYQPYEYAADSLPERNTTYAYRVRGITPFGEVGPPSDAIYGRSTSAITGVPYITSAQSEDNTSIYLQWNFPEPDNDLISGFGIERSLTVEGPYISLNDHHAVGPAERTYLDTTAGVVNYYRVKAHGRDGSSKISHAYFAQLIDSIPPASPRDLAAVISDDGIVTLSWAPNTEADIHGYRIFRSWFRLEESAQITTGPIHEHSFTDTVELNTLSKHIYYRVMAVDTRQNHSALSATLEVRLPDKVPPQSPVIIVLPGETDQARLSWLPGGSEDVVAYRIYRKDASGEQWDFIAQVDATADSVYYYADNTCAAGRYFYYTVVSVDDAALVSERSSPVGRTCSPRSLPPPVSWRKYRITTDENLVTLTWEYQSPELYAFTVFRSVNNGALTLHRTVGSDERMLTDAIAPENMYAYRIIACFVNGGKSAMSRELTFRY